MSDIYKELIALQRANNNVRTKVNEWLQQNVHEDAESLQSIVMDELGELLPMPEGGWLEGYEDREAQIEQVKEKLYKDLLAFLKDEPVKREEVVEVEDPTQPIVEEPKPEPKPKPKPKPKPADNEVATAIVTLLNSSKGAGITEERVREIVREEISKMVDQLYIGVLS
jgi:hypothetical protein